MHTRAHLGLQVCKLLPRVLQLPLQRLTLGAQRVVLCWRGAAQHRLHVAGRAQEMGARAAG